MKIVSYRIETTSIVPSSINEIDRFLKSNLSQ